MNLKAADKIYTIEDIYILPEGERAELIDGTMYMMAPPNRKHQDISMFLSTEIKKYIDHKKVIAEYMLPHLLFF